MSDTNRVRAAFLAESVFGVPVSSGLNEIRYTSDSLKQDTNVTNSAEIRSDRQIVDVVRTSFSVSGDIGVELSYAAHDVWMQYGLMSAGWSSAVTVTATTISAAAADNSFNDSGSGFGSLVVGQWVRVSGFATAANNGCFKILTKTTSKITVSGGTLANEAATPSVTVKMGAQIVNGTTLTTFSYERKYEDLTNIYSRFVGCLIEGFNFSASSEALITGAFNIMGKSQTQETASFGTSYVSPASNPVLNAIDNIAKVLIDSDDVNCTAFSFAVKNNARARQQIGEGGPSSMGLGSVEVTGTFQAYFESSAKLQTYLDFDTVALAFVFTDPSNNCYVVELPAVKLSSGGDPISGLNADVIEDLQISAFRHATEGVTIRIARF